MNFVSLFRPYRVIPNTLHTAFGGCDWQAMAAVFRDCLTPLPASQMCSQFSVITAPHATTLPSVSDFETHVADSTHGEEDKATSLQKLTDTLFPSEKSADTNVKLKVLEPWLSQGRSKGIAQIRKLNKYESRINCEGVLNKRVAPHLSTSIRSIVPSSPIAQKTSRSFSVSDSDHTSDEEGSDEHAKTAWKLFGSGQPPDACKCWGSPSPTQPSSQPRETESEETTPAPSSCPVPGLFQENQHMEVLRPITNEILDPDSSIADLYEDTSQNHSPHFSFPRKSVLTRDFQGKRRSEDSCPLLPSAKRCRMDQSPTPPDIGSDETRVLDRSSNEFSTVMVSRNVKQEITGTKIPPDDRNQLGSSQSILSPSGRLDEIQLESLSTSPLEHALPLSPIMMPSIHDCPPLKRETSSKMTWPPRLDKSLSSPSVLLPSTTPPAQGGVGVNDTSNITRSGLHRASLTPLLSPRMAERRARHAERKLITAKLRLARPDLVKVVKPRHNPVASDHRSNMTSSSASIPLDELDVIDKTESAHMTLDWERSRRLMEQMRDAVQKGQKTREILPPLMCLKR